MDQFKELIQSHQDWLAEHVQAQAKEHGFTELASTRAKEWLQSVNAITDVMVSVLDCCGLGGCPPSPDAEAPDDPVSLFAVEVSRRHRERGIGLAMFMSLLKFYRRSYGSLVRQEISDPFRKEEYSLFLTQFFDKVDIAQCVDWANAKDEEDLARLEAKHAAVTEERNRFLTLVESMNSSVFMLDEDLNIEAMNTTAASLLGIADDPGHLAYALNVASQVVTEDAATKVSLETALPWLFAGVNRSCHLGKGEQDCRFDVAAEADFETRHYTVSLSNLTNISYSYTGYTVVLDDITDRVHMERQLSRERNRAAHYLDVVGSIVVALDASASITLINKAGSEVLGYEEYELLGRNWVDIVIPLEQRDELKDYFYHIISEDIELDDEHINYVTTKGGEDRLISWKNRLIRNEGGLPIGILSSGTDVTEQRAMEETLAEKELWLRNTFVALDEAVFILTPDNVIIDANPAAESMFQMTNQEICDGSVEQLHVDRAHYVEFVEISKAAFARNETAQFEFTLRRSNGELFPSEHSVSLINGDDGRPLGIVSVIHDISRRKEAEQELKHSEEKFRRIFESIEEGYIVSDLNGDIEMVNPATCKLLGYEESELVGEDLGMLYSRQEERTGFKATVASKGSVRGYHLNASRKDGSTIVVEANAHLLFDREGIPVGMEGTFRDITARMEAEKILREREKQYRAFFENNHAIMLLVDPKTDVIVDANPAAANFYGYSVEEMRVMRMSQITAQSEEDIYKEMFKARDENRVYFIFEHLLASGEIRDVEVYSGPIMVQGTQLLYSVIHDVTERIRMEKDMKHMATTDALTGASNRHQFFQLSSQELKRSQRYGHDLCVLMLDIDYFKSINDSYGHQTGDVVLRALTVLAKTTLRETDLFGRLGGEEFAAILPETDMEAGLLVAERLRVELAKLTVQAKDNDVTFTVSIGVALASEKDVAIEDAINRADEALYKAKRTGRNRVEKN